MTTTLHLRHVLPSAAPIVVDLPAVVSDEWIRDLLASISAGERRDPVVPALPVAGSVGTGALRIDLDRMVVILHGAEVTFTRQEFLLLQVFLEHPDRALTRRQLLRLAWVDDHSGLRTVDVHVRRLRVKLGREAHRLVTVRGHGYRFTGHDGAVPAAAG